MKITAQDYEQMKAWFAFMVPKTLRPELITPETDPVTCLEQTERGSPSKARIGLAMAIGDIIEMTEAWPIIPGFDGLPNWSERVWRTAEIFSLLGAYPTAIVFGIPAYFILRRHFPARPFPCAFTGFVIAALPWGLLVLLGSGAGEASVGGRATVIDGHTTAYGWLLNAEHVLTIGLFGSIGGLLFWAVSAAAHRSTNPTSEQQSIN